LPETHEEQSFTWRMQSASLCARNSRSENMSANFPFITVADAYVLTVPPRHPSIAYETVKGAHVYPCDLLVCKGRPKTIVCSREEAVAKKRANLEALNTISSPVVSGTTPTTVPPDKPGAGIYRRTDGPRPTASNNRSSRPSAPAIVSVESTSSDVRTDCSCGM
jgi:hypothetical protein